MINLKNDYIKIPDDVEFLLDLCRDLISYFRSDNPNKELPINYNQISRLRSIEKKIYELSV